MDDELKNVDLSRIRTVCARRSWSQWTTIASREKLYQFMAMSDENTQREMRRDILTLPEDDRGMCGVSRVEEHTSFTTPFRPTSLDRRETRGTKRFFISFFFYFYFILVECADDVSIFCSESGELKTARVPSQAEVRKQMLLECLFPK